MFVPIVELSMKLLISYFPVGFRTFRQKHGGGCFGKKICRNVSGQQQLTKRFL